MSVSMPQTTALYQRYAHAVFCESVRSEVSGQFSFIGIFPGKVALPDIPEEAVQVRMTTAVWLVAPISNLVRHARVVLRLPDGSQYIEDMLGKGPREDLSKRKENDIWTKITVLDLILAVKIGTRLDAFVEADDILYFAGSIHFEAEPSSNT